MTKSAKDIALEAAELVGGDRAKQHGSRGENFGKTAALWNTYLSIRREPGEPLDGVDFAAMMVLAKLSRIHSGNRHNLDNAVDMAGYSACLGEMLAMEMDEPELPLNKPEQVKVNIDTKIRNHIGDDYFNELIKRAAIFPYPEG